MCVLYYAFWNWHVDFGPPSLKYFYTLHAEFGLSKPMIIIDICVVKSWFTFANLQSISQTIKHKRLYFTLYFLFQWPILAYIFAHWSNIACLPAGRTNTQRHLVEAQNVISICENYCILHYKNINIKYP